MASHIQSLSIPTISSLYKKGELETSPNDPLYSPSSALNSKICLIRADITKLATTCIVNAANNSLLGGGGVDGAIHSAAGPGLLEECRGLNGCPTGSAKITRAYDLPSQHVIHAVGPIYQKARREGGEDRPAELLRGCYRTSLDITKGLPREDQPGVKTGASVAFSCLSTGIYGYPSGEAAEVAARCVRDWFDKQQGDDGQRVEMVIFCCFLEKDVKAYEKWLPQIFPHPQAEQSQQPIAEKHVTQASITPAPPSTTTIASTTEPAAKKIKTTPPSSQILDDDKDWEAVEKPSLASSTVETASEAGASGEISGYLAESIDAVDIDATAAAAAAKEEMESKEPGSATDLPGDGLDEDEGVKVEKPKSLEEDEGVKVEKPKVSHAVGGRTHNRLVNDW